MNQVRFSQAAQESLLAIGQFIAVQDQDVKTAMTVLDEIAQRCNQFALFPQMGVGRPKLGERVRCFFVFDYIVIYVPSEKGIDVLDVIHSSRDVVEDYRDLFN